MLYLVFSILCSTLIFVIFKAFGKFGVNNVYAIIANYIVAGTLGFLIGGAPASAQSVFDKDWILAAFLIGFLFIALFQIMALTAQRLGVARVSVPVKMSVVLPVLAGVWFYNEQLSFGVIVGILLALLAVYLGTKKENQQKQNLGLAVLILPAVLFFGNGSIDVLLKYAQVYWLQNNESALFSSILFCSAFVWGLFFGAYNFLVKKTKPRLIDLLWGVILGIPNFGSIYFLLEALDKSGLQSASVYPINNVSVVGLSALAGLFIYKEDLSKTNIVGLIFGIVSIVLISYA